MECCVNALVTSFKETILAECPGMIKRNETDSEWGSTEGCLSSIIFPESHGLLSVALDVFMIFLKREVCARSPELHLMFSLMDKVPSGIEPMLKDLEEHIINAGLADMVAAAETITTVSKHGGLQHHS